MRVRRNEHTRSALFERERPPRLVLRFALVLSVAMAVASALILLVVRVYAIETAERGATRHAELVASTLLQRELGPSDIVAPVSRTRRRELDSMFRRHDDRR